MRQGNSRNPEWTNSIHNSLSLSGSLPHGPYLSPYPSPSSTFLLLHVALTRHNCRLPLLACRCFDSLVLSVHILVCRLATIILLWDQVRSQLHPTRIPKAITNGFTVRPHSDQFIQHLLSPQMPLLLVAFTVPFYWIP